MNLLFSDLIFPNFSQTDRKFPEFLVAFLNPLTEKYSLIFPVLVGTLSVSMVTMPLTDRMGFWHYTMLNFDCDSDGHGDGDLN